MAHIIVLGAGVIGLTTAHQLLAQPAPPRITIVAAQLAADPPGLGYTSLAAGAHFRPQSGDAAVQRFDEETYAWWAALAAPAAAGLAFPTAHLYFDSGADAEVADGFAAMQWRRYVRDFRELADPGRVGAAAGVQFTTVSLAPRTYLSWLQHECEARGATVVVATVATVADAWAFAPDAAAVVNCTGFAARALVGDSAVFPIKGQTVLVKGECAAVHFRKAADGWQDLVLLRPGEGTILGVSKETGDWSEGADPKITEKILERCKVLAPELLDEHGNFTVLSVNVGRRPARTGGIRIEAEKVEVDGQEKIVLHHYGHGGIG